MQQELIGLSDGDTGCGMGELRLLCLPRLCGGCVEHSLLVLRIAFPGEYARAEGFLASRVPEESLSLIACSRTG